jgi:hypothetical protein
VLVFDTFFFEIFFNFRFRKWKKSYCSTVDNLAGSWWFVRLFYSLFLNDVAIVWQIYKYTKIILLFIYCWSNAILIWDIVNVLKYCCEINLKEEHSFGFGVVLCWIFVNGYGYDMSSCCQSAVLWVLTM